VLTMIHRAERLDRLLAALEGRLGEVCVYPVRPRAEAPAHRVLVRARKGSRAPLRLLPGLELHDDSGAKFTPEAEAIFRGEAVVSW
jgi:tRNA1(Val) A37 N6-methylase TrmN6